MALGGPKKFSSPRDMVVFVIGSVKNVASINRSAHEQHGGKNYFYSKKFIGKSYDLLIINWLFVIIND